MLEPPREVPAEVDARVTEIEEETSRDKVRLMGRSMLGFLLVLPTVMLIGVRSWTPLVAFTIMVLVNVASSAYFARRAEPPKLRAIAWSATLFSLLVAVMARAFSPFLLAPAIAAVAVVMFTVDPRAPWRTIIVMHVVAVLVPWLAEHVGLLPRTMFAAGGDLVLRADAAYMSFPAGELGFATFVIAVVVVCGFLGNQLAIRQREAFRSVELQAWHLRQLVKG